MEAGTLFGVRGTPFGVIHESLVPSVGVEEDHVQE